VTADLDSALDGLGPSSIATGVTTRDRTLATRGPTDRVFPLASVTKPLAAYATLVAVDHGRLDLDDVVDDEGRTVRQLLAHASGLAPVGGSTTSAPLRRRVYSNDGFDLLGEVVEEAVGRPLAMWLHAQVLVPLAMHDTSLEGSPAADAVGTVDDLLTFGRELLEPTLVDPELGDELATPQWAALDGVLPGYGRQTPNEWGLGFEIRGAKEPHWTGPSFPPPTFGHFGQSGSFLWVSREDGCAGAYLCDQPFGEWAVDGWPAVTAALRAIGRGAAA
jgi:CubicO group peptidase (beta-lactamase class C family)